MKNVLYTVAVLASLCGDNANHPNVIASVVSNLHDIDQRMLALLPADDTMLDEEGSKVQQSLWDLVEPQMERLLDTGMKVHLRYNDEMPFGERSRFSIIIPNSAWDEESPLYLS